MGISTAIPSDTMYNKIRKLQQAIDEAKAFCEDRGEAIQRLGEMITGLRQLDAQFGGNQYIHQLNNAENTYIEACTILRENEDKVLETRTFLKILLQEMKQKSVEYIQWKYGDQLTDLADYYL